MKKYEFNKNKIFEALSKRAEGFFYNEEVLEYGEKPKEKYPKDLQESLENPVSKNGKSQNDDLYLAEIGSKENQNAKDQNLILIKKKITTHYIPPDIVAIKMLIENFGEEIMGENNKFLSSLDDDELLKLKNDILKEMTKEDENWKHSRNV